MDSFMKLTVHNYLDDERLTLSHSAATLELGRDLAHAALSNLGWQKPSVSFNKRLFALKHDRLYQFSVSPPQVGTPAPRTHVLKDWGVPPGDEETLTLEALEEFIHPKLEAPCARPTQKRPAPQDSRPDVRDSQSRQTTRPSTYEVCLEPPTKRPRHDTASISNLIPQVLIICSVYLHPAYDLQPHYVPGPSVGFRPLDSEHLRPYRKTQPSLIAPFDLASAKLFLSASCNRAAWLIPVRGVLPWDDATCATILEPPQTPQGDDTPLLPSGPAPLRDGISRITWTHHSVVHFWQFLISIQQAENLGSISIGFHSAPSDTAFTLDSALGLTAGSGNRPVQPAQAGRSSDLSDGLSDQVRHAQLEATDFIKVYHDTKYSFYLRNILDAYMYIPGETASEERHPADCEIAGLTTKIRLLRLARLVIVDDRSRAVLLS
ncbi:uncharacterized protein BJ212DRAFT_1479186 [Suillus subaureus]|uniref:Uncharacterized protein n=1 Tax=Suillus subaureus TaxID=48587 RepID=A0A9P7EEG0_9AGAM|nr:uncharacterized protein BJ212DRAFT_1479186 [Suillus subaureus]KAG1819067.1 hypothetical protein BJ212DRAFT_1479186 [Suillus subaureus]